MKTKSIFLLISLVFLVVIFILNSRLISSSMDYKASKESYAAGLNYKERLLDPDEWFNSENGSSRWDQAKTKWATVQKKERKSYAQAVQVAALLLLYLGLSWWFAMHLKHPVYRIMALLLTAIACLHVGLFSPMLEIGAFERNLDFADIPIQANVMGFSVDVTVNQTFDGDMYFYYQSKSVIELIQLLFQQNNFVVGISILLFSVLFPLSKMATSFAIVNRPALFQNSWLNTILLKSGKWSMADVFVVAMFLGFLAFSNMQVGIRTDSRVLIGLYFFLSYCILSIISAIMVERWMKKQIPAV